jgi:hypothetical protein
VRTSFVRSFRAVAVLVLPLMALVGAAVTYSAVVRLGMPMGEVVAIDLGIGLAGLAASAGLAWFFTNGGLLLTDDGVLFVDRRLSGGRLCVHVVPWGALGEVVLTPTRSELGRVGFRTAHYPLPPLVSHTQARAILTDPRYRGANAISEPIRAYLDR